MNCDENCDRNCIACNQAASVYVEIRGVGAALCLEHYGGVEHEEGSQLW